MLKTYNSCTFCNSKKLKKEKKQILSKNFYIKAIISDLNLTEENFNKIKVFKCLKCNNLQNSPWFDEHTAKKIYSNIYGQHNKSWTNLINFSRNKKNSPHGQLFKFLKKNINIKNYAEFNSPFMGIFLDFFQEEYKDSPRFRKKVFNEALRYLSSRQVAGKSKKFQQMSSKISYKSFNKLNEIKKKNFLKTRIKKYLFIDNSSLCWGPNDNYRSVNSKSLAMELFDLEIQDIRNEVKKNNIDLFGIFLTLDHTFEPKKIFDKALSISKYVLVQCHVGTTINKQHLFMFTEGILDYLNNNGIYSYNLNQIIKKKFNAPELYFICSKKKKLIKSLKI